MRRIWKLLRDKDGPTAVEYAVMLACIIAVCIASITLVGGGTYNFWNNNQTQLESAFGGGS
jgi:pilus assembly protein Flp/PilA